MLVTFAQGKTTYSLITRPVGLVKDEPVILPDPSAKPRWMEKDELTPPKKRRQQVPA